MRLSSFIACFGFLLALAMPLHAQQARPPTAELLTLGPGDEVWEVYGHNMLRITVPDPGGDPSRDLDVAYNWGLFDFAQPNFIGNFVLGRMTYTMDGYLTEDALHEYRANNRRIDRQRLNLAPQQVIQLLRLCEENRTPANKDYKYDYFRDNCSTRVRDMIDRASNGGLRRVAGAQPSAHPGLSYRQHALRLMQRDWLMMIGIDFAGGPAIDRPLSTWDACFVPMEMIPVVARLSTSELDPWVSTRPNEPDAAPRRWPALTAMGVACALVIVSLAKWKLCRLTILSLVLWWTLSAAAGGLLLFMWLFTDHWATYRNQNLLHFSPIAFVCLALFVFRRSRWLRWPALVIVAISIFALLFKAVGLLAQDNIAFIGLSLPINLAALWAAWRLTPAKPVDEVASTPS